MGIRNIIRSRDREYILMLMGLVSGIIAYLVADMFGYSLRKYEISYLFWWHLGLVVLMCRFPDLPFRTREP